MSGKARTKGYDLRLGEALVRCQHLYSLAASLIDDATLDRAEQLRALDLAHRIDCDICTATGLYPEQNGAATEEQLAAVLARCDRYRDELNRFPARDPGC